MINARCTPSFAPFRVIFDIAVTCNLIFCSVDRELALHRTSSTNVNTTPLDAVYNVYYCIRITEFARKFSFYELNYTEAQYKHVTTSSTVRLGRG